MSSGNWKEAETGSILVFKGGEKMKLISINIGIQMLEKARKKAKSNGLSLSAYIRQLIAKDLKEE